MRHNYTYGTFGTLIHQVGDAVNKYQFAGEQFDSVLSDYYLRQRFYNTDNGRFSRMDTTPVKVNIGTAF
jgi:RHS repeat-associated protein